MNIKFGVNEAYAVNAGMLTTAGFANILAGNILSGEVLIGAAVPFIGLTTANIYKEWRTQHPDSQLGVGDVVEN